MSLPAAGEGGMAGPDEADAAFGGAFASALGDAAAGAAFAGAGSLAAGAPPSLRRPITVPTAALSATDALLIATSVGASLTFCTPMVNDFSKLLPPSSVTLTTIAWFLTVS